jgi:hypothetical protein
MKIKYAVLTLVAALALVGCKPASDTGAEAPSAPAPSPIEAPATPEMPASTNIVAPEAPAPQP